jgi:hypothetical protein
VFNTYSCISNVKVRSIATNSLIVRMSDKLEYAFINRIFSANPVSR